VRGARPEALADGADAWAAVRPERLALFPGPEADNRIAGTVETTAYHGLDLQVHVRTALATAPLLVRVTAEQAERRPVAPGDTVEVGWSAADTRIFAKD
jgi:spermidine/putrescine transport system ATP-binding protein/putrescine transport system ATP-binding protein